MKKDILEKEEFYYQKIWLRIIICIPFVILAYSIQMLGDKFINNDIIFSIWCMIVIIVVLFSYSIISIKWSIFKLKGYYWLDENKIVHIKLGKKEIILNDVKELLAYTTNFFGKENYIVNVVNQRKNYYIRSLDIKVEDEESIINSSLFHLFKFIKDNNKLKQVDDDGEWYKKEENINLM